MPLSEHVYCVAIAFKMNGWVEQQICIKFWVKLEHSSEDTIWMIHRLKLWATGDWQLHHNKVTVHASRLMQFVVETSITQVTQPPESPDLVPCDFWCSPKLKSPLKGKRFQTINEIQENTMGQLMAIGRTVWGPKVPTLKGTKASLSYVQCFLYLVSSSINVSIFILHGWVPSGQTKYDSLFNWTTNALEM